VQYSLFDHPAQAEKIKDLYAVADELGQRFGKHTLHLVSSHLIEEWGTGRRGSSAVREQAQLKGETRRHHLGVPLLHIKV
jgi:DNA polymerase-4/DNA polymerase V